MSDLPRKSQIKKGTHVKIETKTNQGTGNLTSGMVNEILTSSDSHPYGIKVKLDDGQIGRVKNIMDSNTPSDTFEDLDKKEIPKTEDQYNEFKEFFQYDKKIANMDNRQAIEGIKCSVQERFATAVCSFGNSYEGGFVYLGIKEDGSISGLEPDMKFGGFSDYNDKFANHIIKKLEDLLKDRVFITSKIRLKFRKMDTKTICIIQVLPSDMPIYLNAKTKMFFLRGASPKAMNFDTDEQFKYIKKRFPNYE